VCLAGSGKGFHGQWNRSWAALPGNIHLSIHLSPGRGLNDIGTGLSILPAVSLVEAIDSIGGLEIRPGIRWVNDILLGGSKVAGFLVHTHSAGGLVTGAVTGIGLNVGTVPPVAPTMFVPSVTALSGSVADPRSCVPSIILHRVLDAFSRNYQDLIAGRGAGLLDSYRRRSLVLGRRVRVFPDGPGAGREPLAEGTVLSIGERLELHIAGVRRAVTRGRLVMDPDGIPAPAAPPFTAESAVAAPNAAAAA
jgi:biotin-(acetyl-CoA carboxylase) ligase